jgi:hypothetical protein
MPKERGAWIDDKRTAVAWLGSQKEEKKWESFVLYHDQTVETGRIADTDGHVFRLQFESWQ